MAGMGVRSKKPPISFIKCLSNACVLSDAMELFWRIIVGVTVLRPFLIMRRTPKQLLRVVGSNVGKGLVNV